MLLSFLPCHSGPVFPTKIIMSVCIITRKEEMENQRLREKELFGIPCMITGSHELSSSSDGHFEVEAETCQDDSYFTNFLKRSLWKEVTYSSVEESLAEIKSCRNRISLYKELSKMTHIILFSLGSCSYHKGSFLP